MFSVRTIVETTVDDDYIKIDFVNGVFKVISDNYGEWELDTLEQAMNTLNNLITTNLFRYK